MEVKRGRIELINMIDWPMESPAEEDAARNGATKPGQVGTINERMAVTGVERLVAVTDKTGTKTQALNVNVVVPVMA